MEEEVSSVKPPEEPEGGIQSEAGESPPENTPVSPVDGGIPVEERAKSPIKSPKTSPKSPSPAKSPRNTQK